MISPTSQEAEPPKSEPSKAISDSEKVITAFLKGENPGQNVVVKWNRETKEKSLIFKRTNFLFRKTETENLKTIRDYCQAHEELLSFTPLEEKKTLEDLLIGKGLLSKKEAVKLQSEDAIERYKSSSDPQFGLVVKVNRYTRMPYLEAKKLNILERWQRDSSRSKGAASIWAVRELCKAQKITEIPPRYAEAASTTVASVPPVQKSVSIVASSRLTTPPHAPPQAKRPPPAPIAQKKVEEPKKDILKELNAVTTDKEVVSIIQQAQSQDIVLLLAHPKVTLSKEAQKNAIKELLSRVQENDESLPAILESLVEKSFDREAIIDLIDKIDPKSIPAILTNPNMTKLSPSAMDALILRLDGSGFEEASKPREEELFVELDASNITDEDVVNIIDRTKPEHLVRLLDHPRVVRLLKHSEKSGSEEASNAIKERFRLMEEDDKSVPAILKSLIDKRSRSEVISEAILILIDKLDPKVIPQILANPNIAQLPDAELKLIFRLERLAPAMIPEILENRKANLSKAALFHLIGFVSPKDVPRILANPYLTELLDHKNKSILIEKLWPEDQVPDVPAILAILKNPNSANLARGEIQELISKVPQEQLRSCMDEAIANIKWKKRDRLEKVHVQELIMAWVGKPPDTHHILEIFRGKNYVKFLKEETILEFMGHLSPLELQETLRLKTIPHTLHGCKTLDELFKKVLETRNLILFSSLMQKLDREAIKKMWPHNFNEKAASLLIKAFAQEMINTKDFVSFRALIAKIPTEERQAIFNEFYPKITMFTLPDDTKNKMLQAWESINVRPESS